MSAGDAAPPPRSLIRQVCVAVVAVAVASIGAAERRASAPSDSEPRLEVVQRATLAFAIDRVTSLTWQPADAAVCSSVCLCSTPSDIDWIQLSKWIRVEWSGSDATPSLASLYVLTETGRVGYVSARAAAAA